MVLNLHFLPNHFLPCESASRDFRQASQSSFVALAIRVEAFQAQFLSRKRKSLRIAFPACLVPK